MTCPIKFPTCHRETEAKCPTKDSSGSTICNLGFPLQVYQLRVREDGDLQVTLSKMHRDLLLIIAANGGELPFDYSQLTPAAREQVKKLSEMTLITESELVGSKRVLMRLTDHGRTIVEQIQKATA